jgi:hypothetical protein
VFVDAGSVRRGVAEIDLREAREPAAPQGRIDRPEIVEELARFFAAQRAQERHRMVEDEGKRLGK